MTFAELAQDQGAWFVLIGIAVVWFILVTLVMCCVDWSQFIWASSLAFGGFHLSSLIAEVALIVTLVDNFDGPQDGNIASRDIVFVLVAILVVDAVYAAFAAVVFFVSNRETLKDIKHPVIVGLAFILSLLHPLNVNVLAYVTNHLEKEKRDTLLKSGSSFALNKLLKNIGLVVICSILCTPLLAAPIDSSSQYFAGFTIHPLILLIIAVVSLVGDIAMEIAIFLKEKYFTEKEHHESNVKQDVNHNIEKKKANYAPKFFPTVGDSQSKKRDPTPHERAYSRVFFFFLFPLVVVAHIPHVIFLFGIPLAYRSLRRFSLAYYGRETAGSKEKNFATLNLIESRGVFLFPVSIVGLIITFTFFLVLNAFFMFILYTIRFFATAVNSSLKDPMKEEVNSYRSSYEFVSSCIVWAYIPFLPSLPDMSARSGADFGTYEKLFRIIIFVFGDLLLPMACAVLDFFPAMYLLGCMQTTCVGFSSYAIFLLVFASLSAFAVVFKTGVLVVLFGKFCSGPKVAGQDWFTLLAEFMANPRVLPAEIADFRRDKLHRGPGATLLTFGFLFSLSCFVQAAAKVSLQHSISPDLAWQASVGLSSVVGCILLPRDITRNMVGKAALWLRILIYLFVAVALFLILVIVNRDMFVPYNCAQLLPAYPQQEIAFFEACPYWANVSLEDSSLVTLVLPVSSLDNVEFLNNPDLQTLSFPNLTSMTMVEIMNNPHLTTINLGILTEFDVAGQLLIEEEPSLLNLLAPKLSTIGGSMMISGTSLSNLVLPILDTLSGSLSITQNSVPLDIYWPRFFAVTGYLTIAQSVISSFEVPLFNSFDSGSLTFFSNVLPANFGFPALVFFQGDLTLHNNSGVQNISFPNVGSLEANMLVQGNRDLQSITFEGMENVAQTGSLVIDSNPNLKSITFTSVTILYGEVNITNNPLLMNITFPELKSWPPLLYLFGNNPNLTTYPKYN